MNKNDKNLKGISPCNEPPKEDDLAYKGIVKTESIIKIPTCENMNNYKTLSSIYVCPKCNQPLFLECELNDIRDEDGKLVTKYWEYYLTCHCCGWKEKTTKYQIGGKNESQSKTKGRKHRQTHKTTRGAR